ncbi:MBL fold metallo-hydrolase [Kribbella solani]|uniref:MBL fold metallo-hydrolase n=1 Tax=Kribbella solani TaxID=236067 RepID=UPI0029A923DA|nr:MBL fold metallo-hydrolase [Kribbella solani]MDX2972669.1 MBL fold metallo-hydrolase [Kribbella solani]MDX3001664.1 MBL fold metallo-hydrolase [Kribbella solani]
MSTRSREGLPVATSHAQFEAWFARGVPPVEQVRDDVWSLPLPLPAGNPVVYVNCYVLAGPDGLIVVDPGWDHDEGWRSLNAGLRELGHSIEDVTRVLVTHFHPDHYGLAPRLRAESGARVLMHPADGRMIGLPDRSVDETVTSLADFLRSCGAPAAEIADLLDERSLIHRMRAMTGPDDDLAAGPAPGGLEAIWTPGHTPGHLCFYLPRHELLLTGDHVLPRISPNVSVYDDSPANPLGDFLTSQERLRGLPVAEVLPAHEYRFTELDSRLDEIVKHHGQRGTEVLNLLAELGATSSWELASRMRWSRPWTEMPGYTRRSANGEVLAHLVDLARHGHAIRTDGSWTVPR